MNVPYQGRLGNCVLKAVCFVLDIRFGLAVFNGLHPVSDTAGSLRLTRLN